MVQIVFIEFNGTEHRVSAPSGHTLMEAAVSNGVPGILAECGGACACATCHVLVGAPWRNKLPERTAMEAGMLEGAIGPNDDSRLACQITIEPELDGLIARMPEHQI